MSTTVKCYVKNIIEENQTNKNFELINEDVLKVNCNTEELLKIYDGDKSYRKEVVLRRGKWMVEYYYNNRLDNGGYTL